MADTKVVSNNSRRKYLRFVRMFFSWVKDEGHVPKNPTDGIKFKADDFNGSFYNVETTERLLLYVAKNERDLIGYFALLTFAGLRPVAVLFNLCRLIHRPMASFADAFGAV